MECLGKGGNTKPKKELNKKKIWKLAITIIFTILFIVFAVLYTKNYEFRNFFDKYIFRKEVNSENLSYIEIDSSKNINVFAYSRYIVVLDQNQLKIYNKYGNQEHVLDVKISNPIFEAEDDYLCIGEKGGQNIYLISNKNIVWQKEIEGNISSININKNGYVSAIISGTSYKTVVQVFDSKGNGLFKKYLSSTNVIDTDISNDNKYLAIAEANFSGIVVQSNIKVISIQDAQTNSTESIKHTYIANPDNLIINIKYNNKNELMCMYDTHIDLLKEGNSEELINFKDEDLLFADINLSNKFTKIIKRSEGILNSVIELQIVNSNNQNVNTYRIESTPKKMYVQDDMIALNLGTGVLFINDNGWLVKEYKSHEEVQRIVLSNDIAGVICKGKIKIISL